jgi:hypothetical protein
LTDAKTGGPIWGSSKIQIPEIVFMVLSRTPIQSTTLGVVSLLVAAFILSSAATLPAQVLSNPRIAEFDPSPDHFAVLDDGNPAVMGYELDVYLRGASAPFATVNMGKPSPDADGKIRYDFSSRVSAWPLTGGEYEARVGAVGPQGSALSDPSNPFTFTTTSGTAPGPTPACTVSLGASTVSAAAAGGSYAVDVISGASCKWYVTTALTWVTAGTSAGTGSVRMLLSVQANPSSSGRTGTVNIGGATLTVLQAGLTAPTISWPPPASITVGTALSSVQLNARANVPGSFIYSPAAGTVLPVGQYTLKASFTPSDLKSYAPAKAYVNLAVVAAPGTATAPRATPVITWPMSSPITEGTALSSAQLRAGASVPGTFVYTPGAGTVLPAGVHTLSLLFTPTDTAHYTTATATSSLTVVAVAASPGGTTSSSTSTGTTTTSTPRATPVITWPMSSPITQGTALSGAQLRAGASVPGTFVYTPGAGTVLPAGVHTLSLVFTPTDTLHYTTATATSNLTVFPAATPGTTQ